jgi:hypothetical protein
MKQILNIKEAIHNLRIKISEADRSFDDWIMTDDEYKNPSWLIERCYIQLLAIAEALELEEFRKMIQVEYDKIKISKDGFSEFGHTPDGDPYSLSISIMRRFVYALGSFFPKEDHTIITKDLLQIIRDIHYVITDKVLFRTTPSNENDIHLRIEGILKCVFPDLKHKPSITKQIKNFEPDTGIPSIETLIEYKFLSSKEDVPTIADQVLADTRGYTSREWNHFLYVIYETNRFRTEKDWNQLLIQSGVPENTSIVVLSGEPPKRKRKKK